jgi:hypothetical protein
LGNWLSVRQAQTLLNTPDVATTKGLRDRAIAAVLLGCGLRRSEVAALTVGHVQQRDGRSCRSCWKAWPCADDSGANVGEAGDGRVDFCGRSSELRPLSTCNMSGHKPTCGGVIRSEAFLRGRPWGHISGCGNFSRLAFVGSATYPGPALASTVQSPYSSRQRTCKPFETHSVRAFGCGR